METLIIKEFTYDNGKPTYYSMNNKRISYDRFRSIKRSFLPIPTSVNTIKIKDGTMHYEIYNLNHVTDLVDGDYFISNHKCTAFIKKDNKIIRLHDAVEITNLFKSDREIIKVSREEAIETVNAYRAFHKNW